MKSIDHDPTPNQPTTSESSVVRLHAERARRALGEHKPGGTISENPETALVRAVVRDELAPLRAVLDAILESLTDGADEVLAMDGAAKLLGVSSKTVLAWVRHRRLPGHKIGAEWRFSRSSILRWFKEQEHVC